MSNLICEHRQNLHFQQRIKKQDQGFRFGTYIMIYLHLPMQQLLGEKGFIIFDFFDFLFIFIEVFIFKCINLIVFSSFLSQQYFILSISVFLFTFPHTTFVIPMQMKGLSSVSQGQLLSNNWSTS